MLIMGSFLHGQATEHPPNIVLLLADDLGYGETGAQGNPEIPTPHIDSIATHGVRFTQGYVTAAFCSASRAGLMTGRYQTRFGYEFNPTGAQNEDPDAGLPVSEKTIADLLSNAGYTTGLVGKWHLGGTAKYHPFRRGFDEFFGFLHEGHYYLPPPYLGIRSRWLPSGASSFGGGTTSWLRRKTLPGGGKGRWISKDGRTIYSTHLGRNEPDYDADNPIYRAGQPVEEGLYLTDAFTREAVDFIDRNADRPFFLCLAYNAVHSPMQATDHYMKRFGHLDDVQRRIFAAMLAHLDDSVGEVLGKLRKEKLEDNTLIFFISDNGGPTAELTSSNLPLRGGKGAVYEGGIRVPFMAQWKGTLPEGEIYSQPVISLDIFATVASLAKAPLPKRTTFDGVNLIPYLTGAKKGRPHQKLFWRIGNRTALRLGDWKLLRQGKRGKIAPWELYHLAEDIGETMNLASEQPAKLEELQTAWKEMNAEMIDPLWSPKR
ncbi:MAG: sulfatase-like hydrolase/transferase [Planctomycetota bacterium]|nr:sulfatase-like hydrolase/transferase [Planctomycetota bacterium]